MKYYEVCPSCGGNPEMDEDGNYYTCFACCDTGAVAVEETYEETISRELNEAFEEYQYENYGPVTHRFIFNHDIMELHGNSGGYDAFHAANTYFNPTKYGQGSWVANEDSDIYEYCWVKGNFYD